MSPSSFIGRKSAIFRSVNMLEPHALHSVFLTICLLVKELPRRNLMASSTALQLDKSSWPSQILLVYCLGTTNPTLWQHRCGSHSEGIAQNREQLKLVCCSSTQATSN